MPRFFYLTLLFLHLCYAKVSHRRKNYDGYKLYKVVPQTDTQLSYLQYLWLNDTDLSVDFWTDPGKVFKSVDIMVPPAAIQKFNDAMESRKMNMTTLLSNVQSAIEMEKEAIKYSQSYLRDSASQIRRSLGYKGFKLDKYHRYRDMQRLMKQMAEDRPHLVQLISLKDKGGKIMKTHEGRELTLVKIGRKKADGSKKPAYWIDGGIHAREWIAVSVPLYIMNDLLTKYDTDKRIKQYVDELDFYLMPVVNPDGYEYSRTVDRMWRKNRNSNDGQRFSWCWGVDLNRNFDWAFGGAGASADPCKETYRGRSAFSEPESEGIRFLVESVKENLEGFVTLHSYSQIWMYPYGHARRTKSHDWQDLEKVAKSASARLKSFYGTKYSVDTGANALYPAAGGSDDWAKGKMGVKYVYLLELRPEDNARAAIHGFLLPPSQIIPTSVETWAGLQVVADAILHRKNIAPAGPTTIVPEEFTTRIILKAGEEVCKDTRSDCDYYNRQKRCHWVKSGCRRTCDECGGKVTTQKPDPCQDQRSDCSYYLNLNRCSWVEKYCDKTCGKCKSAKKG